MTQTDGRERRNGPASVPQAVLNEYWRQHEHCLRIGSALYIWRDHLRARRAAWLLAVVLIAILTMMQMLLAFGGDWADTIAAFLIFLTAGALTGYFAFHSDLPLEEIGEAAGEFVNLSDRFRQGTVIRSAEFDEELKQLMNEKARQWRATPPLPGKYRRKYLSGYLPPRTRLSRVRRVLIWITRQIRGP